MCFCQGNGGCRAQRLDSTSAITRVCAPWIQTGANQPPPPLPLCLVREGVVVVVHEDLLYHEVEDRSSHPRNFRSRPMRYAGRLRVSLSLASCRHSAGQALVEGNSIAEGKLLGAEATRRRSRAVRYLLEVSFRSGRCWWIYTVGAREPGYSERRAKACVATASRWKRRVHARLRVWKSRCIFPGSRELKTILRHRFTVVLTSGERFPASLY